MKKKIKKVKFFPGWGSGLAYYLLFFIFVPLEIVLVVTCSINDGINFVVLIFVLTVDILWVILLSAFLNSSQLCVYVKDNYLKSVYLFPKKHNVIFNTQTNIYFETVLERFSDVSLTAFFVIAANDSENLYDTLFLSEVHSKHGFDVAKKLETKDYMYLGDNYSNYRFIRQFVSFENFITKDEKLKIKLEKMEEKYQKRYGDK